MRVIFMFNINYIIILSSVIIIATGQILFKLAARSIYIINEQTIIENIINNKTSVILVVSALLLYMASTVAWVYALRTTPLSVAFMFNSLAFVFIPVASFFIFQESLPRYFLVGTAMIIGGIILMTL